MFDLVKDLLDTTWCDAADAQRTDSQSLGVQAMPISDGRGDQDLLLMRGEPLSPESLLFSTRRFRETCIFRIFFR
jgi:hypothetical protein